MSRLSDRLRRRTFSRRAGTLVGVLAVTVPVLVGLAVPVNALAAPTASVSVSVEPNVGNVIEVRPDRVDLMVGGLIQEKIFYPPGPLTIDSLVALVARPSWIRMQADTVELRAGLFQAPQTSLVISAPTVRRVLLIGDGFGVGGTIRGTAATVQFRGVAVSGWDGLLAAPATESAQRPYLYYVHGSSVVLRRSSFDHLGRAASGGQGVTLGSETTGTVTRATFSHSHSGLSLVGTGAVTVARSSALDNSGDGILVKAAIPVQLQSVTSRNNAGYGVEVRQTRATRLIGITTAGNSNGGIRLAGASQTTVTGVSSSAETLGLLVDDGSSVVTVVSASSVGDDRAVVVSSSARRISLAGVSAHGSHLVALDLAGTNVRVSAVTISGGLTGVSLTRQSSDVRVSQSAVSGVGTGIVAGAAARGVVLSSASISQVRGDAVHVSSSGLAMRGFHIDSASVGLRVYGAVGGVSLADSTIRKSPVGVTVARSVRDVSLRNVAISGATTGVSSSSPKLRITDGSVTNSLIAMRLGGGAAIAGTSMSGVREGLRVASGSAIVVSAMHLSTAGLGLRVAAGSRLWIDNSVIGAKTLAVGHVTFGQNNLLPAEKLRWYGLAAVIAAGSGLILETLRRLREKPEDGTWLLPAGVLNTR